ncbi:MAG: glycosyltransferase family 4 protein [Bacteroidetes bacterium]|nr:glycosyltransferase family 4 protein [Bacteroidota bacterium]
MAKLRNVLFLQSSSEGYGSAKILLQVLPLFQRQGLFPHVVLTNPGPLEGELNKLQVPYSVQNLGILRRKYLSPLGLLNRLKKLWTASRFLSQLHSEHNFEMVYSNTLAVIVGAIWAKYKGISHQWHIHEIVLGPSTLVRGLSWLMDYSTPQPIAVSQAVASHWQAHVKKAQLQVIHNGLPYDSFTQAQPHIKQELGLPENALLVGMVGRINPGKGQFFFLEAAEKLAASFPDVHFVLVGDPFASYEPLLEQLKASIQDLGLSDRVSYLGFREDIPEIMASLSVFVLPSILPDSFPTVVLEAMASGTPVVATESGGTSEMIEEGVTGFLVPIGEVDTLVKTLEKLLSSRSLRKKMGEAGQIRVHKEFSLEAFQAKLSTHLWALKNC